MVFGQVLQAGQGQVPSRQAQIKGGIPKEVSSETVNKVCASGLRAGGMVDQSIRAGDLDVAVGGGMESMSNAPYLLQGARFGFRMGDAKAIDSMMHDGLTNPFWVRGWARRPTRWATSWRSPARTWTSSRSAATSSPSRPRTRGGCPRRSCPSPSSPERARPRWRWTRRRGASRTLESLAGLKGAFHKDGSHTAGNAPGVNDGAGAIVYASDEWAKANGRPALATIVGPGRGGGRLPLPGPHPRQRGQEGAGQGRAAASTTSTCSRSTRPSPRSRSTRCGCSAWTSRR